MADGRYRRLKDEYGQVAVAIRRPDGSWNLTFKRGIESYSLHYYGWAEVMDALHSKGRNWKVVRSW